MRMTFRFDPRRLPRAPAALARLGAGLAGRARAFRPAARGVAAVEFALILPVMLTLYLGLTEVTQGVTTDRKLTLLSRTVADLVGRSPAISDAVMDDILNAALSVMAPNKSTGVKIVVSSIVVKQATNNGPLQAEVCWSDTKGGTKRPVGPTPEAIPEGFRTPNSSYILAEVELPYKPMIGHVVSGTINLAEKTPWPVRNVREVSRNNKTCLS